MSTPFIIYIVPGSEGQANQYFYLWLQNQLEKMGFTSIICEKLIVNPRKRAEALARKYPLTDKSIVVGHSMGAMVALKWLEKKYVKIVGLLLVDPSTKIAFEHALKDECDPVKQARVMKYLRSWRWKLNLPLVRKRAIQVIVLSERRMDKILFQWKKTHQMYARQLGARFCLGTGTTPHFMGRQEPAVLKELKALLKTFK